MEAGSIHLVRLELGNSVYLAWRGVIIANFLLYPTHLFYLSARAPTAVGFNGIWKDADG